MNNCLQSPPKENILVVDDTPNNLRLLSTMLSDRGYKVRSVINGQMALIAAEAAPPDLILLDIMMPDMNGYAVCSELKSKEITRDIPIIFLSALDEALDKVKAFQVGGIDYITKPFQFEEVVARIENQLTLRKLQKQLLKQNTQLQQEIRERQRVEEEIRFLLKTTQAISESHDFHSALEVTLQQVCKTIGWDFGEAWIPVEDGTHLECSQGWYGCDRTFEKFRRYSEHCTFFPQMGLPGRIWSSRQPEWISDLEQCEADVFVRSEVAIEVGFKSVFGLPILIEDHVLAVLVFLKQICCEAEPRVLELVNALATQLGSLIQRKKAEAALREANLELLRLSNIDGLTGVANRRRFDEYIKEEWRRLLREKGSLSLILCDVDFFKRYNDTYGHQAGDDCLRQIAEAISRVLKRPADLVARYGGEEFATILPYTHTEGAIYVAESLRAEVENLKIPHSKSPVSKYVTLSLGVASVLPSDECEVETLITLADCALYEAKNKGRNQVCFKDLDSHFEIQKI